MNASLQINLQHWQDEVAKLNNLVVNEAVAVFRWRAKHLLAELVALTPPTFTKAFRASVADEQAVIKAGTSDQALGQRKVVADSRMMFFPMSRDFLSAAVAECGNPIGSRWFQFGSGSEGRRHLQDAGVVFDHMAAKKFADEQWKLGGPRPGGVRGNTIGGPSIRLIPFDAFFLYLQREKSMVGKQKGAWTSAARAVGLNPPGWINRFAGEGQVDVNGLQEASPRFTFTNRAKGIKRSESLVSDALRIQAEKMSKDLKRRMRFGSGHSGFHHLKGVE